MSSKPVNVVWAEAWSNLFRQHVLKNLKNAAPRTNCGRLEPWRLWFTLGSTAVAYHFGSRINRSKSKHTLPQKYSIP